MSEQTNWYAVQPDLLSDKWRVVNLTRGSVIIKGVRRDKALTICEALKANQAKRRTSIEAGR